MSFQFQNTISLIHKKLKKGDYEVKPFKAYKKWEFASDNSTTRAGVSTYYGNYDIKIYRSLYPENNKYFGNVVNISSSLYERSFTTQSLDPKLLWYYLDHNYYTNHFPDKVPTSFENLLVNPEHFESGSVFVIPQDVFGEGIKPGSFVLNHSGSSEFVYRLQDDGKGNIVDTDYDTSKIIDRARLIMYVGFNEKYREYGFRNKQTDFVYDGASVYNDIRMQRPKLILFESGIPTSTPVSSSGTCAVFGGGYLKVNTKNNFNFNHANNFSISFWIKIPTTQTNLAYDYNVLFDKKTMRLNSGVVSRTGYAVNEYQKTPATAYPFNIVLTNTGSATPDRIKFSQSSGVTTAEVSSSQLTPDTWYHVVCQKSGSVYSIYLDGSLDSSQTQSISNPTVNDREMHIGGDGTSDGLFYGSLDEIRIYNRSLTTTEISALADNSFDLGYAYQRNVVGNIFYKHGIVSISDPRPKYANCILGETGNYDYNGRANGFYGSFRSTVTLYEHEIICRLKKNEFNFSMNESLRKDNNPQTVYPKDFATSSFFNPYITTVGLYNDNMELLAIAKLASPLEKRDDVDMNIIIRWDV